MIEVTTRKRGGSGPAFFSFGFRPFFYSGALFAAIAMPLWVLFLTGLFTPSTIVLDPMHWHAHEMIFGYLGAIIGGFLLTAVPNWTKRAPIKGVGLASLLALWLVGRTGIALASLGLVSPATAAVLDPRTGCSAKGRPHCDGRLWALADKGNRTGWHHPSYAEAHDGAGADVTLARSQPRTNSTLRPACTVHLTLAMHR